MKLFSAFAISFFVSLSAFAAAPATDAAGNCTPEVTSDFLKIHKISKDFMVRAADELATLADDNVNQDEFNKRMEGMVIEYRNVIQNFLAQYGDFTCTDKAAGIELSSAPLAQGLKDLDAKLEAFKNPPPNSGDCSAEFIRDHKAMTEAVKPHAKAMVTALPTMIQKLTKGEDTSAERTVVRQAAVITLQLTEGFRAQYSGTFACTIPTDVGNPQVIRSEDLDQQIEQLRTNIASMK